MLRITVNNSRSGETYEVRLSSSDPDVFREALDKLKWWIPAHHRNYSSTWKCWYVKKWDARSEFLGWLEDVQEAFGAQIEGDPGPWTKYRRPESSTYEAPPPRRPARVDGEREALAALYLLPEAPPEVIKASYRALAQIHHPDKGGDAEQMKRVNSAFDVLKGRLAA